MSHKHGNLTYQIAEEYKRMAAYVRSRDQDKTADDTGGRIYSFSTMRAYIDRGVKFGRWCKENYNCKTLAQCREHIAEYIRIRAAACSSYTVKLDISALAKLYRCQAADFGIETAPRCRSNISRSRAARAMDRHFSPDKNKDLISFCKSTGLRRCELSSLRGNQLRRLSDGYYIAIIGNQAKGGRARLAPVIGNVALVVEMMNRAGAGKVFPRVHAAADIHSYRAQYAADLYKRYARPLEICRRSAFYDPATGIRYRNSIYRCRNDQRGRWFDRAAMLFVSRALGHNRVSVVGQHYLYKV